MPTLARFTPVMFRKAYWRVMSVAYHATESDPSGNQLMKIISEYPSGQEGYPQDGKRPESKSVGSADCATDTAPSVLVVAVEEESVELLVVLVVVVVVV